jgi:hypothetical protein
MGPFGLSLTVTALSYGFRPREPPFLPAARSLSAAADSARSCPLLRKGILLRSSRWPKCLPLLKRNGTLRPSQHGLAIRPLISTVSAFRTRVYSFSLSRLVQVLVRGGQTPGIPDLIFSQFQNRCFSQFESACFAIGVAFSSQSEIG